MGGASKKPISNVEKRLKKMNEEQQKKQQKRGTTKTGKELTSKSVIIDQDTLKKVQDELKRETIVTPYVLSGKLNVTISVAKKILEELERQGVVKVAAKDRRTVVYVASS